jgi:UDP-N-acetylglucosamine--N-acetylmuramyl-(pentapeptide) pyrophosphoryl-undecaprenol N-acetylglucosamine transferase
MQAVCQPELLNKLSTNIAQLAFTDSANVIAREVCALGETYQKNHGL